MAAGAQRSARAAKNYHRWAPSPEAIAAHTEAAVKGKEAEMREQLASIWRLLRDCAVETIRSHMDEVTASVALVVKGKDYPATPPIPVSVEQWSDAVKQKLKEKPTWKDRAAWNREKKDLTARLAAAEEERDEAMSQGYATGYDVGRDERDTLKAERDAETLRANTYLDKIKALTAVKQAPQTR